MKKIFVLLLVLTNFAYAAEIFDPKISSDFARIKENLSDNLFATCIWDKKTFTTSNPIEFYTEFSCTDGSYNYKFGVWLAYQDQIQFTAESYALADTVKWFCRAVGKLHQNHIESEMSCTQLD